MVGRQDPGNFPCFPLQECCAWTIPEIVLHRNLTNTQYTQHQIQLVKAIHSNQLFNFDFRKFLKGNQNSKTQVTELLVHTIVALLKADMGSSHCLILVQFVECAPELANTQVIIQYCTPRDCFLSFI